MFTWHKQRTSGKGIFRKAEVTLVLAAAAISALFFATAYKSVHGLPSDFRDAPAAYEDLQNTVPEGRRPEMPISAASDPPPTGQAGAPVPDVRTIQSIRELTVATYNIRDLLQYKGKTPEQLAGSAQAISDIAPDLLVLQEVDYIGTLKFFNNKYLNNAYLPFLLPGNDGRGINVAFLVKKDLPFKIEQRTHKNETWRGPDNRNAPLFSRDLPALIVRAEGKDKPLFILFGTHYKSKRTVFPGDPQSFVLRQAQVERTSEIIKRYQGEFGSGAPVLLAGDFNGELHYEKTFDSLWKIAGFTDCFDLLARPPPAPERTTHIFFPPNKGPAKFSQIDAVLVSPSLRSSVRAAAVYRYKDERGTEKSLPKSFEERNQNPSDHYPVAVTLDFQSLLKLQ